MNNLPTNFKYLLCSLSKSLFNTELPEDDFLGILTEAKHQTVLPLVYAALSDSCDLTEYQSEYFNIIANNVKITEEHKALHRLLFQNNIPYVFLKGCVSARYYPDPLLRTMGDVDVLVKDQDIDKTVKLLLQNGYTTNDTFDGIHLAFKNTANSITIELHRKINGIPESDMGDKISALFSNIFEEAVLENGEYFRPCNFHHGLILLLHTASHLTSEGIGLRHLCDWAVFAASFTDEDFCNIFENPLKDIGLWKFAQILTNCAIKYLNCPQKEWVGNCDDAVIDGIIADIFSGGNFGKKDSSRYQQIKYISNRADKTITSESSFKRLLSNTKQKAKDEISFVKKMPILLPFGCAVIVFKYIWLIITKRRKLDSSKLITNANKRKTLYNNFDLFKPQ